MHLHTTLRMWIFYILISLLTIKQTSCKVVGVPLFFKITPGINIVFFSLIWLLGLHALISMSGMFFLKSMNKLKRLFFPSSV